MQVRWNEYDTVPLRVSRGANFPRLESQRKERMHEKSTFSPNICKGVVAIARKLRGSEVTVYPTRLQEALLPGAQL